MHNKHNLIQARLFTCNERCVWECPTHNKAYTVVLVGQMESVAIAPEKPAAVGRVTWAWATGTTMTAPQPDSE